MFELFNSTCHFKIHYTGESYPYNSYYAIRFVNKEVVDLVRWTY